jgi:hypothetical protein
MYRGGARDFKFASIGLDAQCWPIGTIPRARQLPLPERLSDSSASTNGAWALSVLSLIHRECTRFSVTSG